MALVLDHIFILTEPGAPAADRLLEHGLIESHSRVHPGQGTANRVFCFQNMALEFLWIHDEREASTGPAQDLMLVQRLHTDGASPYGLVLRDDDPSAHGLPFPGWSYQPDYFPPTMTFHVGENSRCLEEPLCIFAPFTFPEPSSPIPRNPGQMVQIRISAPATPSVPLRRVGRIAGVELSPAPGPMVELAIRDVRVISELNFLPTLPMRLRGIA